MNMTQISILAIVISIFALAINFAIMVRNARGADMKIACHEAPADKRYWTWREIQQRRCWFRGASNTPKQLLFWGPDENERRARSGDDDRRVRVPTADSDVAPVSVTPGSFDDRWEGVLLCRAGRSIGVWDCR